MDIARPVQPLRDAGETMNDDRVKAAMAHLDGGDPDAALSALIDASGAAAAWWRAVAAADAARPLLVHVALRDVAREGGAPPDTLPPTARRHADAVLSGSTEVTAAWRPIAAVLHRAYGVEAVDHDTHLAWEVLTRAAERPPPHDPRDVLRLSALARRLGSAQAGPLARSAQELARRASDPDTLAAATALLAAITRADDGDDALATAILNHGARWMAELAGADVVDAYLDRARDLVARWDAPGPHA